MVSTGTVSLTNSTFFGNQAGFGGGFRNEGMLVVRNTTFSGNSAGSGGGLAIDEGAPSSLASTIMAGNTGGNCSGAVTDRGYNLEFTPFGSDSCAFVRHAVSGDPRLGGLRRNGGPTRTMALLAGSPAIDAIPRGANGCGTRIATDQRGVARPQGQGCDIGAFEVKAVGLA